MGWCHGTAWSSGCWFPCQSTWPGGYGYPVIERSRASHVFVSKIMGKTHGWHVAQNHWSFFLAQFLSLECLFPWENPTKIVKMDDLGGTPILGNHQIGKWWLTNDTITLGHIHMMDMLDAMIMDTLVSDPLIEILSFGYINIKLLRIFIDIPKFRQLLQWYSNLMWNDQTTMSSS